MDIKISEFDHGDYIFLNKQTLCNIAFTGDYNDIKLNKPNLYTDLSNDLDYLYRDLRNVDVDKARSNLGIGSLAYKNDDDAIVFKELHITDSVRFLNANAEADSFASTANVGANADVGASATAEADSFASTADVGANDDEAGSLEPYEASKFLYVKNDGSAYWDTMPLATSDAYGVVKLSDDYTSTDSNTAPTVSAVNSMYSYLKNRIDNTEAGNISQAINVIETIDNNGVMRNENNLSELTNIQHEDPTLVSVRIWND